MNYIIINNLGTILDERGIKQTWVAKKAGITDQTISNCIKDRYSVSLEVALKIALALNMSVHDIWNIKII